MQDFFNNLMHVVVFVFGQTASEVDVGLVGSQLGIAGIETVVALVVDGIVGRSTCLRTP